MYVYIYTHTSFDGHLGYFHVLTIVNNTAVNIGVHVYISALIYSGYMPRIGIPGSYGGFMPSFLRNPHTVFQVAASVYIPTSNAKVFPLLHTLSSGYCL